MFHAFRAEEKKKAQCAILIKIDRAPSTHQQRSQIGGFDWGEQHLHFGFGDVKTIKRRALLDLCVNDPRPLCLFLLRVEENCLENHALMASSRGVWEEGKVAGEKINKQFSLDARTHSPGAAHT